MIIEGKLPQLFSCRAVESIEIAGGITEENGRPSLDFCDRDPRSHFSLNGCCPMDAPGFRIEGIKTSILTAGENSSAIHRRLGSQNRSIGKCEGPFHGELRQVVHS